jgi:hypothetical protein
MRHVVAMADKERDMLLHTRSIDGWGKAPFVCRTGSVRSGSKAAAFMPILPNPGIQQ